MVCAKCVVVGTAGAAFGTVITQKYADKSPFLRDHPLVLPTVIGIAAFALSSTFMTYGGYRVINYIYNFYDRTHNTTPDSNIPLSCHDNEKPHTTMGYTFLPANFTTDSEIVTTTKCAEGSAQNERFTLTQPINHVFGRGGLDVFVLGDGEDHLYFSMCSTKIIDGHVSTIYNFNGYQDKIHLFCTKKPLDVNDVTTNYNQNENVTYIEIAGKFEPTAIAVVGDYPNLLHNIALNEKYTDVVATGICTEGD